MLYFVLFFIIVMIARVMRSQAQKCTQAWTEHFDGRDGANEQKIAVRVERLKQEYADRYRQRVLFGIVTLWFVIVLLSIFRQHFDRLEMNTYYLMILCICIFVYSLKSIRQHKSDKEFHHNEYFLKSTKNIWRVLLVQTTLIHGVLLVGSLLSSAYFYALGERYSRTIKEIQSTDQIMSEDWIVDYYRVSEVPINQQQAMGHSYRLDRRNRIGRLIATQPLVSPTQRDLKLVLTRTYSDRTRLMKRESHLIKVAHQELHAVPMLYNLCLKNMRYSEITSKYIRALTTPERPQFSLDRTFVLEWVNPEECHAEAITMSSVIYDIGVILLMLFFYVFCFHQVVACQSIVMTYVELYKDQHNMST